MAGIHAFRPRTMTKRYRLLVVALCRVRDPDSSVRAPLVCAAALAPLADAVLHEPDQCAQLAATLAAAAAATAVEASEPIDDLVAYLRGLRAAPLQAPLQRGVQGQAHDHLPHRRCLGSLRWWSRLRRLASPPRHAHCADDWAARKAAAESLALLALEHGDDLVSHKSSCITVFEAKRFDKVGRPHEIFGILVRSDAAS
jgi:hypothetical protein